MATQLTERDLRLLTKCASARWLTTSQIRRYFFGGSSADAVRKRLRKLSEAGYLHAYQPHHMVETMHTVGPKGKHVFEGRGLEVVLTQKPPKHREHLIGVNDIRVVVEQSGLRVVYFFAAWELGKVGWASPVIPDAVFAIEDVRRLTCLVEYDRGTETPEQFSKKMGSYLGDVLPVLFDVVIIVVEDPRRLRILERRLRKNTPSEKRFLGAAFRELVETGINAPIFVDLADHAEGRPKRFLTHDWMVP